MDLTPVLVITVTLGLYVHGQPDINFCPMTWTKMYDRCHKFANESLDFFAARKLCLGMGADLMAIPNDGFLRYLQEKLPYYSVSASRQQFWTGLQRRQISPGKYAWKWTDGTPPDFFLEKFRDDLQGYGSAVWMDEEEFGIAEVNETKPFICQRHMMVMEKQYCANSICVRLQHYGANHSGESSKEECLKKGSDIPTAGGNNRPLWGFLLRLMEMYKMNQPVWVQDQDGTYQCWKSIFDRRKCQGKEKGRTVCITDHFRSFKVPQCPCHWNEWNDKCGSVAGTRTKRRTHAAAVDSCRAMTSELATINTLEDFNYYRRTTSFKFNGGRVYWIGNGSFVPTIQTGQQCLVLNVTYHDGKVTRADVEERNCLEEHLFICEMGLQAYFPKSICEAETFRQVCYHTSLTTVLSSQVVCEKGQQLSTKIFNAEHLNIKHTKVHSAPLWKLTGSTGCLPHWIRHGNTNIRLQPQKSYTEFLLLQSYDKTLKAPYICVTEHILLSAQLGIGIAVAILALVLVIVSGGVYWWRRHRMRNEDVYSDCRPVLPPRNATADFNLTPPANNGVQIHFQRNDAYAPF